METRRADHENVPLSRPIVLLVSALAAISVAAPASAATSSGCSREYSYAGFQSATRGYGVSAKITAAAAPDVAWGHVAGWVGVGGVGWGPSGTSEWLQVGLAGFESNPTSELYYEVTRPHDSARLHVVQDGIQTGQTFKLGVLEMAHHKSWWRVWVNDHPVTKPIYLPASDGTWAPQALAESWNGGTGACNDLAYQFDKVVVARGRGGNWRPMRAGTTWRDQGFSLLGRAARTFLASASF